ncbi:MAG: methyltransferase domain-containing protein [Bryobacteraceae bacterium]|nr:methyltransferase domain-containing protein [Bryobacteraceae bacterium]
MRFFGRFFQNRKPQLTPDLAAEIRRSFEQAAADEEHFPSSIDPRILHVRAVIEGVGPIGAGARVLDAGCGKGRFAVHVANAYPGALVVALDLACAMLRCAPPHLGRVAGSMLELPFPDSSFDAAYATESLEHAVDIERAVGELCRVLKPGGRLVIIDKNARHWGRLETPPWEKWFREEELLRLLRRHCRSAACRPISYWEDVAPDGLFLCWIAVK